VVAAVMRAFLIMDMDTMRLLGVDGRCENRLQ